MTLDGLLGALALFAALFAFVPAVQKLRASLAIPVQATMAICALLVILWLQFYEPFLRCPAVLGDACSLLTISGDQGTVARKNSFLVILLWAGVAYWLHRFSRVGISSVPAMARLATRLIDENRLGEAISLLVPNIDLFVAASRRRGQRQHLHDRLANFGAPVSFLFEPTHQPRCGEGWPNWIKKTVRLCAAAVPAQKEAENAAIDILELIHRSPRIIKYLSEERPDLAVPLLRAESYNSREFSYEFLRQLISRTDSIIYQEIGQILNSKHPVGYDIAERSRIIYTLFSDSKFAYEISAWKPIGDYLIQILDGQEKHGYVKWLNGNSRWYENECWRCPVFICLLYFDIMVTSALAQGVRYHMWLFYFPIFADRLAKNYRIDGDDIDRTAEFPTRSARLLCEIFNYMGGWILALPQLPIDSPHRSPPNGREDGLANIPLAAARALGQTFAHILRASTINTELIITLHANIISKIRELPKEGPNSWLRRRVISEIVCGGKVELHRNYHKQLIDLIDESDSFLRIELQDYRAAIASAMQG